MKNGPYELVIAPDSFPGKKYRNRYAYEHIVNFWLHHNITPHKGMEIHHINGNHRDNRIENLLLVTSKEHKSIHAALRKIPLVVLHCDFCSKKTNGIKNNNYRYKISQGQKYFFCSQACQANKQHELGGKLRN